MNAYQTSQSWPDIPGVMGDDQEERRKRLESEVTGRLRDLSLERSSTDYSVEYPRHAPLPNASHNYPRSGGIAADVGDDSLASPHDTFSTVAHHASNLTIRGGLRGRTDADSPSQNAEYDPDRKIDAMLRAQHNLSILNESPSHIRFIPRAVERQAPQQNRKLAGALDRHGSHLSPKRPRHATSSLPHHSQPADPSPLSEFTALANNLGKQIDHQRTRAQRQPLQDNVNGRIANARFAPSHAHSQSHIHLPDVTGITDAAATPMKGARGGHHAFVNGPDRTIQANVVSNALDSLSRRLRDLERENAVSRRRVTELELELETCKTDVVRERTRLSQEASRVASTSNSRLNRSYTAPADTSFREMEQRYKQAVQEKKALEDLVNTLRKHLARITSQLQEHQDLIERLHEHREADARQLRNKCQEVEDLRTEVDKLASEVERLRDIVESGLRERRDAREDETRDLIVVQPSLHDEPTVDDTSEEEEEENDSTPTMQQQQQQWQTHQREMLSAVLEETEPATLDTPREYEVLQDFPPRARSGRRSPAASSSASGSPRRFIGDEELRRVKADLDERRSLRSNSTHSDHSRSATPQPEMLRQAQPTARNSRCQRQEEPMFPQIRGERLERLFSSVPEHDEQTCHACHGKAQNGRARWERDLDWLLRRAAGRRACTPPTQDNVRASAGGYIQREGLPPQTVLTRVLRELEDDFAHYKSIYIELSDEYRAIDAASNVTKRHVLAQHLRDVIDTLEQKGDQIASLYDLLHFHNRPATSQ